MVQYARNGHKKQIKLTDKKIPKFKRSIAGLLIAVMLGNYLGYLPLDDFVIPQAMAQGIDEAEAADSNPAANEARNELGLIAILVEENLMDDPELSDKILLYAQNAQSRIDHSKAFLLEVAKNESTFKIASVLEKLYYEGVDTDLIDLNPLNDNNAYEDNNRLIGVVLIGDVPVPVVHEDDGSANPSMYPYVDFYRKAYIYNHQSDLFEVNADSAIANPEIWHGLIVPPSKDVTTAKQELIDFFDKNHRYTLGEDGYSDFEQRVMYANYPEMEKQMNYLDFSNYRRYIDYMEEMIMNRFNKHLLKEMIKEVSADMGSPDTPIMDDETIDQMLDVHTETIFKKYAVNFAEALRVYRSGINGAIEKTGRWSPSQVDTPESLITLRDEYAKYQIRRKQLLLESDVNRAIADNIPPENRELKLVPQASVKIKLNVRENDVDENTFLFNGFIDGDRVSNISDPNQCGILMGQRRPAGTSPLENNSVLVEANRMYDPETLIEPPDDDDDWKLENTRTYKRNGGCVFNNSIANDETGADPERCIPEKASESIFNVVGAKEVAPNVVVPPITKQCSIEETDFKAAVETQYTTEAAKYEFLASTGSSGGSGFGGFIDNDDSNPEGTVDKDLEEIIDRAYSVMGGNLRNPDLDEKSTWIIQRLMRVNDDYTFELTEYSDALNPGWADQDISELTEEELIAREDRRQKALITIEVTPLEKTIDSIVQHVEPTNQTIRAIKHIGTPRVNPSTGEINFPPIITPSTPADGIRSVTFLNNGFERKYDYLNLFRLTGDNPGEIVGDLLRKINTKQLELNAAIGSTTTTYSDFFVSNSEIVEPLLWKTMSIDQKLKEIIPKYLNRDSFMPTPNYNPARSPQNKPDGYEVLHVIANGDVHGYQFGLSRAMEAQAPDTEVAATTQSISGGTGTGGPELSDGSAAEDSTSTDNNSNFLCGDPSGVEIWEWFDALQCWIEEEILPANELFSISNVCATQEIDYQTPEDPEDVFAALETLPARFEVEMKRRSLVRNQEQEIVVKVYDAQNQPILGYIETPVHIELQNPAIGELSSNDFYIFSGERKLTLTAKQTGSTRLTFTMGSLPQREFIVNVYDRIDVDWDARESIVNGRSQFTVKVGLKDPSGTPILNINDNLVLGAQQPADGGFNGGGNVSLTLGKGETTFMPTPGKSTVTLISKDNDITGETIIHPSSPTASQIILKAPHYIPIGGFAEVEVIAADSFGYPAGNFSKTITVALDEESKDFATLSSPSVTMLNGKGSFSINAGKFTKDIKILAQHPDLNVIETEIPLLARVDSAEWESTYPQNLFGSFVGFPAGDFTQEDYFGGTHLFAGKTEAVYSFMNAPLPEASLIVASNNLITLNGNSQIVLPEFSGSTLLLQAFDQKTMRTLVSKKMDLNFSTVEALEENDPETGKLYAEVLDTDYSLAKFQSGFRVRNADGQVIANIQPNRVQVIDHAFKWNYEAQPEFNMVELHLSNGITTAVRLLMNFTASSQETEAFEEIDPNLNWERIYGGKSINDPTGLYFYQFGAEVTEEDREEFYGIEGSSKYISLFASGTNVGEAVKPNMPRNAILLGDPTISLKTRSNSSLNFNSATGEQLFQDPENRQITSIAHFNFNNDGFEDIAVLMEDGRVRLLEGGPTKPPYIDRGDMVNLADGGVALENFDFDSDFHDDLVVATAEGRLAILRNNDEVITRSDQQLNIGKKMYKLLKADMDQDGFDDLVIHDSRGDIYIFYYDSVRKKFPTSGKWIGNYGYTLKLSSNVYRDLDIRYAGMAEPAEPGTGVASGPRPALEGYEVGGTLDEDAAEAHFNNLYSQSQAAAESGAPPEDAEVPKLPWPEGDEVESYFAPIEDVSGLNVSKRVSNKDRPGAENVDLEETLTYTVTIDPGRTLNDVVLADTVPDSMTFLPESVTCVQGNCDEVEVEQNTIRVFFSGLNFRANQRMVLSYDAFIAHTPESDLLIQRFDEPNENLSDPDSIIDQYLDIAVSPPYNTTGRLLYHYSTGARTYARTQDNAPDLESSDEAISGFAGLMEQMQNFDPENPEFNLSGLEGVLDEATGANSCFEDASSSVTCAEGALDDIASAVSEFNCGGAGCFPMPFNYAFLVPPQSPTPILAFPATLPTPVGPIPMISSMFFPLPGMAAIPGPIMSLLRLYISPTLTGGLGLAMCWGPYPMVPTVPPPVFPIPYPPPIGNCMVTATPMLPKSACDAIEDGMSYLVDQISAGVNKINSAASDVAGTWPGGTAEATGPDAGAGGLEISLGVNLGNSMRFDPPAKAFSNTHIEPFDSIGGVIAGWFDRQVLEIQNKLLTLPTFSIFLPDFKSLFTLDFEKTEKRYDQWINTLSGAGKANIDAINNNPGQTPSPGTEDQSLGQQIRGGLQDLSGSKALAYTKGVENIASTYNLSTIEGLYDVASTMPMVKLHTTPIQFNVPWLSAAEIQAFIMAMQDWVVYYEREYSRVKDKWESLTCAVEATGPDATVEDKRAAEKALAECAAVRLAQAFGVNFDELINSVTENIAVLQAWLTFPKQLIKFKQQLADYIRSVACYLEVIAQMLGGWMATLQQQMISWAELILTIIEIVKNIKELFDVFTNFDSNCDICTNERYGNFGWWSLLGLVLPDIPIIQFPKWPDIVLDLSNIDMAIDIEIPELHLRTIPIPLPPLPYITLPDLPTISMFLSLPPLPILPGPPELPELPGLPPIPTIDLPTLPAPPKLPDVAQSFEVIIPLLEKILQIWCLMKKSFAPVPEMALNDQITLLTNRPAYLIPLDLLKVSLPKVALFDVGFNELRIETVLYLGLRINIIATPLEEAAKSWNEMVQTIPDTMNEAYKDYLEATEEQIQNELDEAGQAMEDAVQSLEEGWSRYVQGWLDENVGDPLEKADAWLRDQEQAWQEWANEQAIDWSYQQYMTAVNNLYVKVQNAKNAKVNEWFDKNRKAVHAFNNVFTFGIAGIFEIANEENIGDDVQDALDLVGEKLNEVTSLGPTVLQRLYSCIAYYDDCKENEQRYFRSANDSEEQASLTIPKTATPLQVAQQEPTASEQKAEARRLLATPQGQEMKAIFDEIAQVIQKTNDSNHVDYTVLKEAFNVPDYVPAQKKTSVDQLRQMEEDLLAQSETLMAEAHDQRNVADLPTLAGMPPRNELPAEFASNSVTAEPQNKVTTNLAELPSNFDQSSGSTINALKVELNKQVERAALQSATDTTPPTTDSGCGAAVCLPDPITHGSVPVIPFLDFAPTSETLFMPSGDVVYNDGTGLYLKRNLTLDYSGTNTDTSTPARFTLNNSFLSRLSMETRPKEAVNMLQSTFTENGAATFTWAPSSNPEAYGYGIDLERTITGYDSNRKNNAQPDTKIILLPPEPDGSTPEVIVNGQTISSGTLITSLTDREEASRRFGITPRNIVTGARDVSFPTINDALIRVDEDTAVYFDLLNGSAYSMNMENGFYQIKMTWFGKNARTATYNRNELLAPQIYAEASEPIDISQSDTFYMPIFKSKSFRASEIFVDLSSSYKYYWFIDPDNNQLTPQVGSTLTIAPQKEEKKIKVKLIATQDLADDSFQTFEKEFFVQVYVPGIELSEAQLTENKIAGTLVGIPEAPEDDLSDIPFSVFRKRLGTWKNLGILHDEDSEKEATIPPLNDHEGRAFRYEDSYYTAGRTGDYVIENFDLGDPSGLSLKDPSGNPAVDIEPGGGIDIMNENYELRAMPATQSTPTHIAITNKDTDGVIGSVYYVASASEKVEIVSAALSTKTIRQSGVTVGDVNPNDDYIAAHIPDDGPSFPGGVAIFNKTPPLINVALVDKNGAIRMMQDDYKLELQELPGNSSRYVFRIVRNNGTGIYDVYIHANFDNVEVDSETDFDGAEKQIGLKAPSDSQYAQYTPNAEAPPVPEFRDTSTISDAEITESPFPDLDESHPFFQQILELYKSRVISGYGDGSFRPDQKLTRAEFIKIALGVTNCYDCTTPTDPQRAKYTSKPFPDVSLPAWYYYCTSIAKELGMITGYGDGLYRPDRNISRAEAAAVLLRQSGIELSEAPENFFADVPDYAWYVDYVYTAVQIGLIKNNGGFVIPDEEITRGEFAFMAAGVKDLRECRLVDEDGDGVPDWWEMTHNMDPLVPDAERACPCFDNPNQDDTDGDSTRDVCDLDIDSDTVLNPMCIFDSNGKVDPKLILQGAASLSVNGERVDNCIFNPNTDQVDYDSDGIGDACDEFGVGPILSACPCLDNPNKNDTDGDQIPDVCDDDIDNDSILNPICIFDKNGLLDDEKLEEAEGEGPVDNCIFNINTDQADGDQNGIGNSCELVDLCPEVPEDMDGVDDDDGCPEVNDVFDEDGENPGIHVGAGDECSLMDFKADILEGDIFMTAITDIETHEILHSNSVELPYKQ